MNSKVSETIREMTFNALLAALYVGGYWRIRCDGYRLYRLLHIKKESGALQSDTCHSKY